MNIGKILEFAKFTHLFQQVQRTIFATNEERNENDAEHSYQLALIAWYINNTYGLNFDDQRLIKYALTHDLIEVYAGDTYFHTKDTFLKESKAQREHDAFLTIQKLFKEFDELTDYIEQYEKKGDQESRFIYALDKILPVINIYLDNGRSWKRDEVTYDMIRTKDEKIALSPQATKIWVELIELLETQPTFFHDSQPNS